MTQPDMIRRVPGSESVSIVVPVYRGEATLPALVAEVAALRTQVSTPTGRQFRVDELVLVWDHGPDFSDQVIRALAAEHDWIRPVWLSRNFGQHAATIAGMAVTGGDWIVTMDEDGQHDPEQIGMLLDAAHERRAQLVYAAPANKPPHGPFRNLASTFVKTTLLRFLSGGAMQSFHSYRFIAGDVGRAVAAYAGPGVYLDVALSWAVSDITSVPVAMRNEGREAQNYRLRALTSHVWRLVVSSGNRPLRLVSGFGLFCAGAGVLYAMWTVIARLTGGAEVAGWTSIIVFMLVLSGVILASLGVIAEYVGMAASMSMGRPVYVALDDPARRFGPGLAPRDASPTAGP